MKFIHKKTLYLASSFLAGFSIMVVELISSRIVAPIIGASVFTWTSVIGLTLFGLAIGGWVGGRVADRVLRHNPLPLAFLLSAIVVALIPLLAQHTDFITSTSSSILTLNLLLSIYLFLLPAFAIGTIQPIILKKYSDDFSSIGSQYGALSAAWSVGSMLGVFLTGFFFISTFGTTETIWIVALLLFALACVLGVDDRDLRLPIVLTLVVLFILIVSSAPQNNAKTLFQKETNYYNAKVVDADIPNLGKSRLLFLDFDVHSIQSSTDNPYLYTGLYPVFSYLKNDIEDILVIGAGAYTMPKHFKDYYEDASVTVLETDSALIDIGNQFFDLESYDIKTDIGDAQITLQKDTKKYDVIFGDAYNSFIAVPWYLLTKEWNDTVRERLTPNGVYAVNFIGSQNGSGSEFTKSLANTFRLSFPNYYIFAYGTTEESVQNIVLVGVNGDLPLSEKELEETLSKSPYPLLSERLIPATSLLDENAVILTNNFSPVERLMNPLIKKYFSTNLLFMQSIFSEK